MQNVSGEPGTPERPAMALRLDPVQVLMDASAMLLASTNLVSVLSGILNLASQIISADAYAVWRTHDGKTWRVVAQRGLSDGYRTEVYTETRTFAQAIHAVSDVLTEPSLARHRPVYAAEAIASLLSVPLILEGESTGTITFYWKQRREVPETDITYASALANLASAALTLSELHEQTRREQKRLTFLAEASAVLSSSLDYEITLRRVADLAVSHIADWCTVHIVAEGAATNLVVAHSDPAMVAFAEEYSQLYPEQIRDDRGIGLVLRTGQTQLSAINDELLQRASKDDEQLRRLRALRANSILHVPLQSRGAILGVIRLISAGLSRPYSQADIPFAEDLAHRAAVALENAQLHRAVSQQENQLRLTHASTRIGSWSFDLVKQRISWSPEYKAIHGLPPDAVASFEAGAALIHPEDRDEVLGGLKEVLASTVDQLSYEHRVLDPQGRILWMHSRGRIERDAHGHAISVVGISIDVTERRHAEDALRRTEKLAAAGRLAATVAHEVNNPLEALMNLIYLAQHVPGLPAQAAIHLATAEGEINRMAHIVRQTLGFYRESTHPRLTNIGTIVTEVLALYQGKAHARSVILGLPLTGAGISAVVNGGEIKQVVANLVSNAIDASPPGAAVQTIVREVGDTIEIVVSDSGTGISDASLQRLFEPFFTTKSDVGTGLGLWVSKGIIDKHRGSIRIDTDTSAEAHGSTFTVSLPFSVE